MDIKEKVKSFEDACNTLGLNPEEFKIQYPEQFAHHSKAIQAHLKLVIIAEALNEGWTPNWDDWDERKYYPWFDMEGSSGSGFSFHVCVCDCSDSHVGSRLCFASRELAEYAGEQFTDLYKDYFVTG